MQVPAVLRKQLDTYRRAGFNVVDIEHRNGSHWLLTFAEFSQRQIITQNASDPRALKNNIARYRRLAAGIR